MDSEKIGDVLTKLQSREVKRPALEQFILRIAAALALLQCVAVVIVVIVCLVQLFAARNTSQTFPVVTLIAIPLTFIYSFALFVVFKRVYEI